MKNTTKYFVGGIVLLLIIVLVILQKVKPVTESTSLDTSPTPVAQVNASPFATPTSKTAVTTSPKTVTTVKTVPTTTKAAIPNGTSLRYEDYVAWLSANQTKCRDLAATQYNRTYFPALEQSTFQSYFSVSSGSCYVKVTGKEHIAYATTTTGKMYFRNTNTGTVLAECTDPTGTLLKDDSWICKNNVNGQNMNKAQFNAFMTSYTN
ncbi:MAG: hypothetical protein WCV79_00985 [Candidatus Paceibacterota bacterium]